MTQHSNDITRRSYPGVFYPNSALTEICQMLLRDYILSSEQIANLANDIPGECEAMCEDAYERQQQSLLESGGPDDSSYRRDMIAAGRGHLLK